jgi:hypothetical protein
MGDEVDRVELACGLDHATLSKRNVDLEDVGVLMP